MVSLFVIRNVIVRYNVNFAAVIADAGLLLTSLP